MKKKLVLFFSFIIFFCESQIINNNLKGCYKNMNEKQWYSEMVLCFDGNGKINVQDQFVRNKSYFFTKNDTVIIYGYKAYSFLLKDNILVKNGNNNIVLTKLDTIIESPVIEESIRLNKAKLLNEYYDLEKNGKADLKWYISGAINDSSYCKKIKDLCTRGLEVACVENLKINIVNDFGGISSYFNKNPEEETKEPNPEIVSFADSIKKMGDTNVYNVLADYYIDINHKELAIIELKNAYEKGNNASTPTLNMLEAEEHEKDKKHKKK